MAQVAKKILVLYAHPSQERSEINTPLFKTTQLQPNVTAVDLYGEYPTFRINIDREQQRLRDHDIVVFMFPLYWYSTPAILKEWQDLVLEYNFAYGAKGKTLCGKTFLCALSAGGSESAYCEEGYNHFSLRELLRPLEQMANLTGMNFLAPFALFCARTASEENRVDTHVQKWIRTLRALSEDRFDIEFAQSLEKLNGHLDQLIREH
ncbi:NAD(P)H dehydrogenase (quinone) [Shewanella halifaxensis HAW-EB4]|uniref:NAD(P)H dehydrogenase (Quinone) n=1 Tax=Shewanella halifaxensis (strain HAW-EB4) TaxID=458817 RepID=B0TKM7_SHEHH|nr:NAD(P)H-dependent oxidoreductase [Shewanella halifaxensis]ABZ75829.1 NAD(P)H dehydrogenase (quinone) [Shewanella halifaxensis HAW-EB4]